MRDTPQRRNGRKAGRMMAQNGDTKDARGKKARRQYVVRCWFGDYDVTTVAVASDLDAAIGHVIRRRWGRHAGFWSDSAIREPDYLKLYGQVVAPVDAGGNLCLTPRGFIEAASGPRRYDIVWIIPETDGRPHRRGPGSGAGPVRGRATHRDIAEEG